MRETEKRAMVRVLRSHPEWTLANLLEVVDGDGVRAQALGSLTVHELLVGPDLAKPKDGGPMIDLQLLCAAQRADGAEFDAMVLHVLGAATRPVGASYLAARVGGPRWKLQRAMRRLAAAGKVERRGTTSNTRYATRLAY